MEYDLQNGDARTVDPETPADSTADAGEGSGELDIDVLDAIEGELADVERALERLGAGTYGRCEACGEALTGEELVSAPAGRFCRAHRVPDRP